jgi:hypothetical protein
MPSRNKDYWPFHIKDKTLFKAVSFARSLRSNHSIDVAISISAKYYGLSVHTVAKEIGKIGAACRHDPIEKKKEKTSILIPRLRASKGEWSYWSANQIDEVLDLYGSYVEINKHVTLELPFKPDYLRVHTEIKGEIICRRYLPLKSFPTWITTKTSLEK